MPKISRNSSYNYKNNDGYSVGEILEWYIGSDLHLKTGEMKDQTRDEKVLKRKYTKWENLPYHVQIYKDRFLKTNFPSSCEYNYGRVKGIIVHATIDCFIEEKLLSLPIYFSKNVPYYKLYHYIRRSIYVCLNAQIKSRQKSLPQIQIWYAKLLYESMISLESFLDQIFSICIDRLMQDHLLDHILEDFMPYIHETNNYIRYHKCKFYFKPDWIVLELNRLVIHEFKTGGYYPERIEKSRIQTFLFAWFVERHYNMQVDRCEIHYMDVDIIETYEFTPDIRKFVRNIIVNFIDSLNSSSSENTNTTVHKSLINIPTSEDIL